MSHPNIQNILGRVVDGNPSLIDGIIQVTGGNSNLYLMNPSGIIFGANSSLNVPGDFTATTATGIGFGEDTWFNAIGNNNYETLIGTPQYFNFNSDNNNVIINRGNLEVSESKNITLLSGQVINTGTIEVTSGNITLSAIEGNNIV